MTQANVQTDKEVCFLAKESTFGTLPAMKALIIEAGSWECDQNRTQLDDMDGSALLMDQKDKVDSLFEGSGKFRAKFKPYATQITGAAPATQPALFDAIECAMGGMQVGAGSVINAGTTSSVTVVSDASFEIGQVVGISGSSDVQLAIVESKPGANVIEFWPAVGVAVTTGTLLNGYSGFVAETNVKSLSAQHAYPDSSSEQEELRGCHAKFKLTTELNSLVMAEFEVMPATGQRGALSIATSVQTNVLASGGHAVRNAICYIQAAATTTRTNYCVEKFSVDYDPGMEFVPCHTGVEGKDGVMRVKGRGMAKLMLTIRADTDEWTAWTARTKRRVLYAVPVGSGTGKRWVYVYMPNAGFARSPKLKTEGGRRLIDIELMGQIVTSFAANTIGGSPLVVGAL